MEPKKLHLIKGQEETASKHDSQEQPDQFEKSEDATAQIPDGSEKNALEVDDGQKSTGFSKPVYEFREDCLFKIIEDKETPLANFDLKIAAQRIRMDEDNIVGRDFQLDLLKNRWGCD